LYFFLPSPLSHLSWKPLFNSCHHPLMMPSPLFPSCYLVGCI
jgi:hypothetical protein